MIVGLISDTHGSLSQAALTALRGVDHIFHAGDIGSRAILSALAELAPVTAVRGNTDYAEWARRLPRTEMVVLNGFCFYLLHDLTSLDLDPHAARIQAVVSGHTHRAAISTVKGVLYINPGSASQSRYGSALSVARIEIAAGNRGLVPEILILEERV